MNVANEELKEIREELDKLQENDVLFVEENGIEKYAVIPIELYDSIEGLMTMMNSASFIPQVQIAGPDDFELSYDEYEKIKEQIMEAVEKTLMPKPEKLN